MSDYFDYRAVTDPGQVPTDKQHEFAYNKILDGYIGTADKFIQLMEKMDKGVLTPNEVLDQFSLHIAQALIPLMLLDQIRNAQRENAIDKEIENFRKNLGI